MKRFTLDSLNPFEKKNAVRKTTKRMSNLNKAVTTLDVNYLLGKVPKNFLNYLVWGKKKSKTIIGTPFDMLTGGKVVKGKAKAMKLKKSYQKKFPESLWNVRKYE